MLQSLEAYSRAGKENEEQHPSNYLFLLEAIQGELAKETEPQEVVGEMLLQCPFHCQVLLLQQCYSVLI